MLVADDWIIEHESRVAQRQAPVAQLDRASASEAEGHRFESCRAHHLLTPEPVSSAQRPRRVTNGGSASRIPE